MANQLVVLNAGCENQRLVCTPNLAIGGLEPNMNLSILALRVSDLVKQSPLIHKALRRVYCVFRPGIRFRIEKEFQAPVVHSCSDRVIYEEGLNLAVTDKAIDQPAADSKLPMPGPRL